MSPIALLTCAATVAIPASDTTHPLKPLNTEWRVTSGQAQVEIVVQLHAVAPLPGSPQVRRVASGDIDGDGRTDFLGGVIGGIFWWRNLGNGALATGQAIALAPGRDPIDMDVVDLDGDGDLDVLVTYVNPAMIAWYENLDGAGQFSGEHVAQSFVNYPQQLATGDLDGDADLDFAIATRNLDPVRWHENDGLGGFGEPQPVGCCQPANGVALADVDGDDDLDVISVLDHALVWSETLDDLGSFETRVIDHFNFLIGLVAAGDIDGDGDIDAVASSNGAAYWYENLGGPAGFGPRQFVGFSGSLPGFMLDLADLDGDGDLDVITGGYSKVRWWENTDGAGTFALGDTLWEGADLADIGVVDLDGDQHFDILLAQQQAFYWLENLGEDCNGNGTPDSSDIQAGTSDDCNLNGFPDECELNTDAATDCNMSGTLDTCELVADCDFNGLLDECSPDCNSNATPDACDVFAGSSEDCNANVIPDECESDCNGNGIVDACDITAGTSEDCTGNGVPDECEPDCNGNGRADICDLDAGSSQDCTGNGIPDECEADCNSSGGADTCETDVAFSEITIETFAVRAAVAADLDGDGDEDLVASSEDDATLAWYENLDGLGTLGARQVIFVDVVAAEGLRAVDLDVDGDLDLITAVFTFPTGPVSWYENRDGAGLFGPPQPIGNTVSGGVVTLDVDADGDPDVLTGEETNIIWHENTGGQPLFGHGQALIELPVVVYPLAAVDVDGDDLLDLITRQSFTPASTSYNRVHWYRNLGGTFDAGQQIITTANATYSASVTDLDGDGNVDIVAYFSGLRRSEYDPGAGAFGAVYSFSDGGGALFAPADVDGDGDRDIITWYDVNVGGWRWFEYRSEIDLMAVNYVGSGESSPPPRVAVDLNGDGNSDLLHFSWFDESFFWSRSERHDCDGNGTPDDCDPDCDADGLPDACEPDCNGNGSADICDILGGSSDDCSGNGVPDECEPDCNQNDTPDDCDIDSGTSLDCQLNGIPDECESPTDCNGNGIADVCDIGSGASLDCESNGVPDECESPPDCNGNGIADECDIGSGTSLDCQSNGVPDECDLPDCNENGVPDACEVADGNGDCNLNGTPDECDLESGSSEDLNENQIPDECEPDCNANGILDELDVSVGESTDCNGSGNPDECDTRLSFLGRPILIHPQGDTPVDLDVGDMDGDGDPDFFGRTDFETIWAENLDGEGTFGPYANITDGGAPHADIVVADIDGDGLADLVAARETGVLWYRSDGSGFSAFPVVSAAGSLVVDVADVDGDGDNDVLVCLGHPFLVCFWYQNLDGIGTFFSGGSIKSVAVPPTFVAAADLDGDDDPDAVYAIGTDIGFELGWVEALGSGVFGATTIIEAGSEFFDVEVADLDQDGDPDIAGITADQGLVWFENLDGLGAFGALQLISGGVSGTLDAADLNGDGNVDLLVKDGDTLYWYEKLPASYAPAAVIDSFGFSGDVLGADIDHDGDTDIVSSSIGDAVWYESTGDDCNGNGAPDVCEPDCNANGIADGCDLRSFAELDCNGNFVPDSCEVAGPAAEDTDGDGCMDGVDSSPSDPNLCGDGDGDGCEDCLGGSHDPLQDGLDTDGDGACDLGDCRPTSGLWWGDPSAITSVVLSKSGTLAKLTWLPPASPGADNIFYDSLRSPISADFGLPDVCVDTNDPDRATVDGELPVSGAVFYYLIRVENACPGGTGNMGTDSAGAPRSGTLCAGFGP